MINRRARRREQRTQRTHEITGQVQLIGHLTVATRSSRILPPQLHWHVEEHWEASENITHCVVSADVKLII